MLNLPALKKVTEREKTVVTEKVAEMLYFILLVVRHC